MNNHPNKVLRPKSLTSRGKQVTERNTVVHGFKRAMFVALQSAFGLRRGTQSRLASISGFVDRRSAAIARRPRSALREFKKDITSIKLGLLQGTSPTRSLLGKVLPRMLSKTTDRGVLLQYCRIGRALPKIPVEKQDLKDQVSRMTQEFKEDVPAEVTAVLDKIKWIDPTSVDSIPADFVSSSSCMEATRKKGGRTSLLKEGGIEAHGCVAGITSAISGLTRVDRQASDLAKGMLNPEKFSLDTNCIPLAIPELGAKVRIVTKHHSALVALSHRSRRTLWPLLLGNRNLSVSESISDPELGTIDFSEGKGKKRKGRGGPEDFVFSADLSAATDYLGWPVIKYICEKAGIPFEHVSPTKIDGVEVQRGTAMGLPASWPVLSLAHYAVCAAVDPGHSFRIKGDDLIALWTKEEMEKYYSLCSKIGFVPNKDKSAVDRYYGVFCEVTYSRHGHVLHRQPDFSIRSFVKNEPLSAEQWRMLVKYGASQQKLNALSKDSHESWFRMARKAKINPFMPRRMGGLGFPPRKVEQKLSRRDGRIVNAVHNGLLPTLIEIKPRGSSSKVYLEFIRKNILWTSNGGSHFKTMIYNDHVGKFLFRGAFVDAVNGETTPIVEKHRDVVRRCGDLLRRIMSQKSIYYPATYGEAYDIIDRLQISRDSNVFGLGASYWSSKHLVPGWRLQKLHTPYDAEADRLCPRHTHNKLTCKAADSSAILKTITQ